MAQCLIGLGSNLGDRAAQLDQASELLYGHPQIQCNGRSTYHATHPIGGPPGQGSFLNAAMRITTQLSPRPLLAAARAVEQQMGRTRRERWGSREIDIDILLYDQVVLATAELIVPHPRMAVRRFVLEPASEVAADMLHPQIGWTVAELLQRLHAPPYYVAIAGIDSRQTTDLVQTATQIPGVHPLLDLTLSAAWPPEDAPQIELVEHEERAIAGRRSQLLGLRTAAQRTTAQAPPQDWYVSNYWLPQSMAMARARLQGTARQHVEQICESAMRQVPLPHCVLFLDGDVDSDMSTDQQTSVARAATRPETRSRSITRDALLLRELAHQASRPGQGPVVHVPGGDPRLAFTELTAAIDAMR